MHRFWRCPAWARTRLAALDGHDAEAVMEALPAIARTHGLLPLDPDLKASAQAAERAGCFPPTRPVARRLWSDGSAVHPKDPWLRQAGWAVVWQLPDGSYAYQRGQAPGRQTVGRAELAAAVWAYRCEPSPEALHIDNRYVVDGIAAVIERRHHHLLKGPDADLWEAMIAAGPRIMATWVPAHLTIEQYAARGLSAEVWHGNDQADVQAKAAARAVAPPPALVASRARTLECLLVAQRVISAV